MTEKCKGCGQFDIGQIGRDPCKLCGLPNVWDEFPERMTGEAWAMMQNDPPAEKMKDYSPLIGREAFYCVGHFLHGRIKSTSNSGGLATCVISDPDKGDQTCAISLLLFTPEEAEDECEKNASYWKRKARGFRTTILDQWDEPR